MSSYVLPVFSALCALAVPAVSAAQVSPEIQIGARGVMSVDQVITQGQATSSVVDFSDSALLLGFREKLYSGARGGFSLGLQFPDADSDLGQVYFHRVALTIEDRRHLLTVGRARAATSLIEFPTLRDDDALAFSDLRNPLSDGENTEDSQFANVVEISQLLGRRLWLQAHGEHFRVPPAGGGPETSFGLNSVGGSVQYRVPETQRWDRDVIQQLGLAANLWALDSTGFGVTDQLLPVFTASFVLNIVPDPVHFFELRHQTHFTAGTGSDPISGISSYQDQTRARSISTFSALGYTYRPLETPKVRASLGLGYRVFPDLDEATTEWQSVNNVFLRLGQQFDVGVQGQYRHPTGDLAVLAGDEYRAQLVLAFSVDQVFNEQFDDRSSILNLEHGYLP